MKYGNWTVISEGLRVPYGVGITVAALLVRCECGTEKIVSIRNLRTGKSTRCISCKNKKHGEGHRDGPFASTYVSWSAMRGRCLTPSHVSYADYGGRGIKICERWNDFSVFLADMGQRPPGMTLDRWPDKNGDYEPSNCRWATPTQQQANRRNSYGDHTI